MFHSQFHRFTQILSTICIFAITYQFWAAGYISLILMLMPYIIVFMLARPAMYQIKSSAVIRTIGTILITLLAIGLLFGIKSDPQAGMGIGFAVVMQFGVIFVSEAIIGLVT